MPRLNDDVYVRILQCAVEEPSPVYGMDEHVPQETLAACMRVSKRFNILTGPVLYRRASVVDFAAFLKGLRLPQSKVTADGSAAAIPAPNGTVSAVHDLASSGKDLARANRPKQDRPTKLKLLSYVERIDIPHPPWTVNRHYTTADKQDPGRMVQFVQRWNDKRSERFAQAATLLQHLNANQAAGAMVFGKLKAVCLGGLTEMAYWRERPEPSALWQCRMIIASRIRADWMSVDTPIALNPGLPRLVSMLASIRPLETLCSATAFPKLFDPLDTAFIVRSGETKAEQITRAKQYGTEVKHIAIAFADSRLNDGFICNFRSLPLAFGKHNIHFNLVNALEGVRTRAPLNVLRCSALGRGLGETLIATADLWRHRGLQLPKRTSLTIYGLLGDLYRDYTPPQEGVHEEYTLPSQGEGPFLLTEGQALQEIERACKDRLKADAGVKAAGLADMITLLTAEASLASPCELCGVGCWD